MDGNYRTAPFLGTGLAWPPRLDETTGGFKMTTGYYDSVSVSLAYIAEKWTIRGEVKEASNHIAESVYNILLTSQLEHETLPWYGSKMVTAIFEPNTTEFRLVFESYLKYSTERWEKRARYPEANGVQWLASGVATDRGELPLIANIEFLAAQTPANLVAPFVTPRQARVQEYKSNVIDSNGHDLSSRYYKELAYFNGDTKYLRIFPNIEIPPAPDDTFYIVRPLDTWMLIAWYTLDNVCSWYYPFLCYIQDKAKTGATRDIMNPNV